MTRSPRTRRDGFTLIELLIVITIIAILASMSFGAYQKVKEAAGRISCTNNIRALGTGIANYASSSGSMYPTGISKTTSKTVYWTIRDQMDVGGVTNNSSTVPAVNQFLCPSRRSAASVGSGSNPPADYGWSKQSNSVLGSTNPVMQNALTDGIGNTILMGHIWVDPQNYQGDSNDSPWNTCKSYGRNASPLYQDKDPSGNSQAMGSPHATGVPHLFCDGGVRIITYDDSSGSLQSMIGNAWQWNRKAGTVSQQIGN
jgi:prepilin-type N-terminal cleavage/methylation domain-containing protein